MGAKLTMLFNLIRNWVAKTAAVAGAQPAPVEPRVVGLDAEPLRHARALSEAGNVAAARRIYEEVLRRDRENSEAQYYLGVLLGRTGRLAAASELLQQVVTKEPQFTGALNALGNVRRLQGQPTDAEGYYRRVLAIEAGTASVWVNLGLCLRDSGRNQDAVDALQRALQLKPDDPDAIVNLALVRNDLGESAEAQALLRRALELDPNMAEAHVELAQILLGRGEFAAGWSEYDWRLRMEKWEHLPKYSCPVWRGEDLNGKTLLVTAEQGLGDQIMFASCLPEVVQAAGQCIVESHSRLTALFERSFPRISISPRRFKDSAAVHEGRLAPSYKIAIGSLPGLLRRHESDFPRHAGYLRADPARVEYWRERLCARGTGPHVGISWRGGTTRTRRTTRSIDLVHWLPMLRQSSGRWVSLQYGDVTGAELASFASEYAVPIDHWQEAIDDYDETAALVSALDLVISVQTAVVHLAGALGKPVWVMVPAVPEWRYLQSGETMPWYPSVRLFRRAHADGWAPVIAAVTAELAKLQHDSSCWSEQ